MEPRKGFAVIKGNAGEEKGVIWQPGDPYWLLLGTVKLIYSYISQGLAASSPTLHDCSFNRLHWMLLF